MKILLADDSMAMRTMFRTVLQRLGHAASDILEAKNGREALSAVQTSAPDLLIFDWDLPDLDGAGIMGQLKQLGLAGRVTVLLSVNRQQRALLPQVSRLGPCESIDRPFTEEVFEAKIRSLERTLPVARGGSSNRLRAPTPSPASPSSAAAGDDPMPFLLRLPSALIDDLLRTAEQRRYEPGAVLLRAGQICSALHIVTRGEIEIQASGRPTRVISDGDLFGELSFMMSEPSGYSVKVRKAVIIASLTKVHIASLLRRHPSLDQHLQSLMSRHKEVMTARATTIVQSDFKGTFDTMPFANVLQILQAGRKTGVLGIRHEELSGGIFMKDGEAIHAWTETAQGDQAFYDLAGWTKARWAFNSMRREEQRTLTKPLLTLLMAAMGRQEEPAAAAPASPEAGSQEASLDDLFPSQ